jgi:hypothetical protein
MEQIVQALNEIKNVIEGDRFTVVMSGILAVTPIILTIITIWLSVRMDKQSKKLQKELADRDQKNQTRSCVLDIYNTYLSAFHMTGQATGNISEIFVSDQSYYKWALEVEENSKNIMSAYNRAKLMLKDEDLINELKKGFEAFSILNGSVKSYIFSGLPTQTIQNAWNQFSVVHPQIQRGDYYALYIDRVLGEEFKALCNNSYTENIQQQIEVFIGIVGCDSFDEKFKYYVKIDY